MTDEITPEVREIMDRVASIAKYQISKPLGYAMQEPKPQDWKSHPWAARDFKETCPYQFTKGDTTYYCSLRHGHPVDVLHTYDGGFDDSREAWTESPPPPPKMFMDYFSHTEEYPDPTETMLKPGLLYEYISSTFLDGWINYVEIKAARLITRYRHQQENIASAADFNQSNECHTNLGAQLGDDVLILAKAEHASHWWYFWYDRDVSDCCIGRFETDDSSEVVTEKFIAYADYRSQDFGGCKSIELKPEAFRGWISG